MKTVDKDTWAVFEGFLEGKDIEIIKSAKDRKLPLRTFKKLKKKAKVSIKLHKEEANKRYKKEGLVK